MKIASVLLSFLLLSACSTGYDPDIGEYFVSDTNNLDSDERPPKNDLNLLAKKLVAEMLSNNQFVSKQNAIAVTSVVDLNSLSKTNRLGHQISEGVVHYLHNSGYRVVDFKLTGTIQVTQEGDFIHSRDWKKLNTQFPIDYLVSGTIDQFDDGIYLSMRMVGIQTRVVVGSSQAFIDNKQLLRIANPDHVDLAEQETDSVVETIALDSKAEEPVAQKANKDVTSKDELHDIDNSNNNPNSDNNTQRVYTSDGYLVREEARAETD